MLLDPDIQSGQNEVPDNGPVKDLQKLSADLERITGGGIVPPQSRPQPNGSQSSIYLQSLDPFSRFVLGP